MKVAFVTPSVSRSAGGIFEVEKALALTLLEITDADIQVYAVEDQYSATDAELWRPLAPRVFKSVGPRAFGYSPGLRAALMSSDADVGHLHVLWMYTSVAIRRWAQARACPYMTSIHGMLDPWALSNSGFKKRLALALYEQKSLAAARCLQVLSMGELDAVRAFGSRQPVCVIPNGVALPADTEPVDIGLDPELQEARRKGQRILIYLGRLHPKKGLPNLIAAFAKASAASRDWVLAIAGWDQAGHVEDLRKQIAELGLERAVLLLGAKYGDEKSAFLRCADAFVLPSFSEGLPMGVLEAWSYRKPVLMTPACNLDIGFQAGAAVRIDTEPKSIAMGLNTLMSQTEAERVQMGGSGRALVEQHFSWPSIATQMRSVYGWMLGGGERPACMA